MLNGGISLTIGSFLSYRGFIDRFRRKPVSSSTIKNREFPDEPKPDRFRPSPGKKPPKEISVDVGLKKSTEAPISINSYTISSPLVVENSTADADENDFACPNCGSDILVTEDVCSICGEEFK